MSTSVSDRCCDFDQSDMGNREQVKHPGVSSNYRLLLYYCSKKQLSQSFVSDKKYELILSMHT